MSTALYTISHMTRILAKALFFSSLLLCSFSLLADDEGSDDGNSNDLDSSSDTYFQYVPKHRFRKDRRTDENLAVSQRFIVKAYSHENTIPYTELPKDDITAARLHLQVIQEKGENFGIDDTHKQLKDISTKSTRWGKKFVRFKQVEDGIPVMGSEVLVRMTSKNVLSTITAKTIDDPQVTTTPRFSERFATWAAKRAIYREPVWQRARANARRTARLSCWRAFKNHGRRMYYFCYRIYYTFLHRGLIPSLYNEPKLYIYNEAFLKNYLKGESRLVWEIKLFVKKTGQSRRYLVDAHTNRILLNEDTETQLMPGGVSPGDGGLAQVKREIRDCSRPGLNNCLLDFNWGGYVYGRSEGTLATGFNPHFPGTADVDTLYDEFGIMHSYLFYTFGRNGANNMGGTGDNVSIPYDVTSGYTYVNSLSSLASACSPNGGSALMTGGYTWYCAGSAVPDIIGHEFGHFITFYMGFDGSAEPRTLNYSGESASIAESYSDYFGEAFEKHRTGSNDWLIGTNSGAITRSLSDPLSVSNSFGLPVPLTYTDPNYYCGELNNGGSHINASVLNKATHLMTEGGTFNGCTINGIGMVKVSQILYTAVNEFFDTSETFAKAYIDIDLACRDLIGSAHGITVADCNEVVKAMQAVEIDQPGGCIGLNQHHPNVGNSAGASCAIEQAACIGDANGDSLVDAADWRFMNENKGSTGPHSGDLDGDGFIGESDCLIWKSDFGCGTCITDGANPNTCLQPEFFPGDYDEDGENDLFDYEFWRSSYSITQPIHPADGNGDGVVDAADYTVWRNNLGSGACPFPTPSPS